MNRQLGVVLLAFLLLLSGWYLVRGILYAPPSVPESAEERPAKPAVRDAARAPAGMDLEGIVERNVFHPERRYGEAQPQPASAQAPAEPPAVMPAIVLKGIVQDPDGEFIAYLSIDGKKAQPVHVGDRIDEIKVVSITVTDVTMKWRESDVKLTLTKVKSLEKKR